MEATNFNFEGETRGTLLAMNVVLLKMLERTESRNQILDECLEAVKQMEARWMERDPLADAEMFVHNNALFNAAEELIEGLRG